jgi:microcompartment protein CcmK/EutM
MNLAKVLGRVVSTRKDEKIEGFKLLMLGAAGPDGELTGATVVAVDAVGAGEGEYVLYATGSSARQTRLTDAKPVDAVVMAIVDSWDIEGEERYRKGRDG